MDDLICELLGDDLFFLRRDALARGLGDKALARLRREGVLHRVRHGAYTRRSHWRSLDHAGRHLLRARCAVRAARADVALSHTSAALAMGCPVWGIALDDVHLLRLDGRGGRREAGVCQHHQSYAQEDLVMCDGLLVTSPTRTCLDLTTITGVEPSLVVVDHLLHRGEVSKQDLLRRSRDMPYSPGSLTTGLTLSLADGRSESVGETRLRYLLWRGGLPSPVPQLAVTAGGRVLYRLDLAWPELGVWLEFDGRDKYVSYLRPGESVVDVVLREKRREEDIARRTGWRCIRVTWRDLADPDRLVARIAAALAGGPVAA